MQVINIHLLKRNKKVIILRRMKVLEYFIVINILENKVKGILIYLNLLINMILMKILNLFKIIIINIYMNVKALIFGKKF